MGGIGSIIKFIYQFIAGIGKLTAGLISILLIVFIFAALNGSKTPDVSVAAGTVLVLDPAGVVVEQTRNPDPLEYIFDEYQAGPPEVSVHDILDVLRYARKDDRIAALALHTDGLWGAAPAHLHDIADAVRAFKSEGKKVYAISTSYNQADYLLASEADQIFLNPAGSVLLTGYGTYPTYFKGLLDKLDADVNIFRVGTYKSAVEPFLRENMSEAAKEANAAFLGDLWKAYVDRVSDARDIDEPSLTRLFENTPQKLAEAGGDPAQLAIDERLVDTLADRRTWRTSLTETYGASQSEFSFKQVNWQPYLNAVRRENPAGRKIAVIVAQGEIVMGYGDNQIAAAETVVDYIRDARKSDDVAAIVLRVDSPGGSAFASELIRQELEAAQQEGKPVVASFGPVAASGGYWISATANAIIASPTTITGSIGIFGVLPTFQDTLKKAGISSDGVGTTPLAGGVSPARALAEPVKAIMQQSIENGYQEFLTLVARGRGMSVDAVDAVAQGRVWTGRQALDHGLVDELGNFRDAVDAAARLADIDRYSLKVYREGLNETDQFLIDLFASDLGRSLIERQTRPSPLAPSAFKRELYALKSAAERWMRFNDPEGHYALCEACALR